MSWDLFVACDVTLHYVAIFNAVSQALYYNVFGAGPVGGIDSPPVARMANPPLSGLHCHTSPILYGNRIIIYSTRYDIFFNVNNVNNTHNAQQRMRPYAIAATTIAAHNATSWAFWTALTIRQRLQWEQRSQRLQCLIYNALCHGFESVIELPYIFFVIYHSVRENWRGESSVWAKT